MKSNWHVTRKMVEGELYYQVFRILDVSKDDSVQNREYYGSLYYDDISAERYAESLNQERRGRERAIEHLQKALCAGGYECDLQIVENDYDRFVIVTYLNQLPSHKTIDVTGDSIPAMIKDVVTRGFLF